VDPELFIRQSIEGLRAQSATHAATWRLGEEKSWSVDQDKGCIQFFFADGTFAEADIQIVGTYNTLDGTYLWGWDHPSVADNLREHAKLAKRFGEQHQLCKFATRKVECSEDEAWEFTAVAARLGNANGAYRAPSGSALVYMTFGEVRLSTPPIPQPCEQNRLDESVDASRLSDDHLLSIEETYREIVDDLRDQIDEAWIKAKVRLVCYSDGASTTGYYIRKLDGVRQGLSPNTNFFRKIRSLRRMLRERDGRVWGRAIFQLDEDGTFEMLPSYDNCDENGDEIFDDERWSQDHKDYFEF
jgi:hypothetical protein